MVFSYFRGFGYLLLGIQCSSGLLLYTAAAQAIPFPNVQAQVLGAQPTPNIDGDLNDQVWREAEYISEFHQIRPHDHGVPSEKTEASIVLSEDFVYVAFKVYDSSINGPVAKGLIQGQSFPSDDRVSVSFDTFNDKRNSYFFQVNPNGVRREALWGTDYFIDDWDAVWYAGAKIHDWGWTAEMAIPLKSIAFDPATSVWGLNLVRKRLINALIDILRVRA